MLALYPFVRSSLVGSFTFVFIELHANLTAQLSYFYCSDVEAEIFYRALDGNNKSYILSLIILQ
jgi:hypothetical protein